MPKSIVLILAICLACVADRQPRRYALGNTFLRLRSQHELTIGYLGGSITSGTGATSDDRSWRALTTSWFRAQFPNAAIREANASIPDTASDLAAFRVSNDLLRYHPNLVFIEFSVNDATLPPERIRRATEGIVRQIWRADPTTDIVFLYAAAKNMTWHYAHGQLPPSTAAEDDVAAHYRIPVVDAGADVYFAHRQALEATYAPDGVHPNDWGHSLYAAAVRDRLQKDEWPAREVLHEIPAPLTSEPFDGARMVPAATFESRGWSDAPAGCGHMTTVAQAASPGTEMRVPFYGNAIGVYWVVAHDSGDVDWWIDNGHPARASSWDRYALQYTRPHYRILADNLAAGPHVLTLRVRPDRSPDSLGTCIRINAFLVD